MPMKTPCSWPTLAMLVMVAATVTAARGQDVASGPEAGKDLPALKVFDATGPNKGKELDYVGERKGKPTVYLFIQADKWDRPMARFLKVLSEAAPKDADDTMVVAIWLTAD